MLQLTVGGKEPIIGAKRRHFVVKKKKREKKQPCCKLDSMYYEKLHGGGVYLWFIPPHWQPPFWSITKKKCHKRRRNTCCVGIMQCLSLAYGMIQNLTPFPQHDSWSFVRSFVVLAQWQQVWEKQGYTNLYGASYFFKLRLRLILGVCLLCNLIFVMAMGVLAQMLLFLSFSHFSDSLSLAAWQQDLYLLFCTGRGWHPSSLSSLLHILSFFFALGYCWSGASTHNCFFLFASCTAFFFCLLVFIMRDGCLLG